MPINSIVVRHFRNFKHLDISVGPQVNVFFGSNAAGKTSLLEAIYYLAVGRSFRTSRLDSLICDQADQFTLFIQLQQGVNQVPVGIERSRQGDKVIRMNGELLSSFSVLARSLPVRLMNSHSHRYFLDGPKVRRQFLDWGLFHQEPTFYLTWQRFQKALKQRNCGLRSELTISEIQTWDLLIADLAEQLDCFRAIYVKQLEPIVLEILRELIGSHHLTLHYHRGWTDGVSMLQNLKMNRFRDQQFRYTRQGPQAADLRMLWENVPAQDYLSQGQQKIAAYALCLAQGILLQQSTGQSPIYLIDDLPSELDPFKRQSIAKVLARLNGQIFMTGITLADLQEMLLYRDHVRLFHVKQGQVVETTRG